MGDTPRVPVEMATRGPDLVAFVTSHFLVDKGSLQASEDAWRSPPKCASYGCALIQWARQAHAIASQVRRLSGEAASVHMFTPCLHPSIGTALSADDALVRVVVHRHYHGGLQRAISSLHEYAEKARCCHEWRGKAVYMMLRWVIFAMEREARVAVYLDLDVEIMPRLSALLAEMPGATRDSDDLVTATGRDWAALVSCFDRSRQFALLSYPDHSSPVHGAVLIARPNMTLFKDGIALIRRTGAAGPFNLTLGWDSVGPPHEVVSHDDHIWRRRRGHTHLLDKDNWDFVNADTDQGFVFHMLRVRHKLGGDLRLTECAEDEPGARRSWPKRAPPSSPETFWFHYGAMGGEKPDGVLRRWNWVQSQRMCARVESINYFADGSEVLLRSLLWARRTAAEVDYLQRWLAAQPHALKGSGAKSAPAMQLEICAASLATGLGCLAQNNKSTINIPGIGGRPARVRGRHPTWDVPRKTSRSATLAEIVSTLIPRAEEHARHDSKEHARQGTRLAAALGGENAFLGRAIPLLASAQRIGGSYSIVPRWNDVGVQRRTGAAPH